MSHCVNGPRPNGWPLTPLKLVCRQIKQETKGIVFRANNHVILYGMSFKTPSSHSLNIYVNQIGVAALSQLRKVVVNGAADAVVTPLSWKEVGGYLQSFKPFCHSHPRITVILRFRCVETVNGMTWLSDSVALKEMIRGSQAISKPAVGKYWRSPEAYCDIGRAVSNYQSVPVNLKFSLLDAVPESEVQGHAMAYGSAVYVEEVLLNARELWNEGL